MIRPVQVEVLLGYKLRITFSDGVIGVIDLSGSVDDGGVFAPLRDESLFKKAHIGQYGQIAWSEEIEICPDSAYLEITGQALSDPAQAHA